MVVSVVFDLKNDVYTTLFFEINFKNLPAAGEIFLGNLPLLTHQFIISRAQIPIQSPIKISTTVKQQQYQLNGSNFLIIKEKTIIKN